jgi:hypothetical protein
VRALRGMRRRARWRSSEGERSRVPVGEMGAERKKGAAFARGTATFSGLRKNGTMMPLTSDSHSMCPSPTCTSAKRIAGDANPELLKEASADRPPSPPRKPTSVRRIARSRSSGETDAQSRPLLSACSRGTANGQPIGRWSYSPSSPPPPSPPLPLLLPPPPPLRMPPLPPESGIASSPIRTGVSIGMGKRTCRNPTRARASHTEESKSANAHACQVKVAAIAPENTLSDGCRWVW